MNKMRYFRKRINRGIVLGILLLVSVILFTVISDSVFKNVESDRIKKLTEDYISDYTELFSNHQKSPIGASLTAEETERMASEFRQFTNKYFAYRKEATGAGFNSNAQNKDEIEDRYLNGLKIRSERCQLISLSLSSEPSRFGTVIKKAGPKNAIVSIGLTGEATLCGDPSCVYLPGMYNYSHSYDEYEYELDKDGQIIIDTHTESDAPIQNGICTGNISLYLEKIDGEWKITYVNNAYVYVSVKDSTGGEYYK